MDSFETSMAFLLGAGLFLLFIVIIIAIIMYVFMALSLHKLGNRNNIQYSWLAWIPIGNLYILGMLVKDKVKIPYMEWMLPGASLLVAITSGFLSTLLGITYLVFFFMALYELYKKYSSSYVVLTIFSILFAVTIPFFLFAIRNNEPIHTAENIDNSQLNM